MLQRMLGVGDNSRSRVEDAPTMKKVRQPVTFVDAATMQIARPVGQSAETLHTRRSVDLDLDSGKDSLQLGYCMGEDGPDPDRTRSDSNGSIESVAEGLELAFGSQQFTLNASSQLFCGYTELREAYARWQALEQPSAKLAFES